MAVQRHLGVGACPQSFSLHPFLTWALQFICVLAGIKVWRSILALDRVSYRLAPKLTDKAQHSRGVAQASLYLQPVSFRLMPLLGLQQSSTCTLSYKHLSCPVPRPIGPKVGHQACLL